MSRELKVALSVFIIPASIATLSCSRCNQAAYDSFPSSNGPPAENAAGNMRGRGTGGGAAATGSVLGKHAEGLVQTFINLVGDDQVRVWGRCVRALCSNANRNVLQRQTNGVLECAVIALPLLCSVRVYFVCSSRPRYFPPLETCVRALVFRRPSAPKAMVSLKHVYLLPIDNQITEPCRGRREREGDSCQTTPSLTFFLVSLSYLKMRLPNHANIDHVSTNQPSHAILPSPTSAAKYVGCSAY